MFPFVLLQFVCERNAKDHDTMIIFQTLLSLKFLKVNNIVVNENFRRSIRSSIFSRFLKTCWWGKQNIKVRVSEKKNPKLCTLSCPRSIWKTHWVDTIENHLLLISRVTKQEILWEFKKIMSTELFTILFSSSALWVVKS
jgi:hypothetical protein